MALAPEYNRVVSLLAAFGPALGDALDDVHRSAEGVEDNVVPHITKVVTRYALDRYEGNQVQAARWLGINRNTLRKRMRLYGLLPKRRATA